MVRCSYPFSEATVALSGTLDTFALPDVLRLLASTAKTGRLRITGDRGSGSVWMQDGNVVAAELASAVTQEPSDAEVVFGLLRFVAGSFTFEADASAPHAGTPEALEPVLGAAENMLVEWRSIEAVIPSLDLWVGLSASLEGPDVMVDQMRWRGISAIGSGAQVGGVAESLNMSEINSCRLMKELIELGLVQFIDEPAGLPAPMMFEPTPIENEVDQLVAEVAAEDVAIAEIAEFEEDGGRGEPEVMLDELDALDDAPSFATDDDLDAASSEAGTPSLAALASSDDVIDPLLSPGDPLEAMAAAEHMFTAGGESDAGDELDPAEMARQLANLSPKAAKAVAAAAKATTEVERDAALAAVEAEDDTVNRGLLLKFLGSVDS